MLVGWLRKMRFDSVHAARPQQGRSPAQPFVAGCAGLHCFMETVFVQAEQALKRERPLSLADAVQLKCSTTVKKYITASLGLIQLTFTLHRICYIAFVSGQLK